MDKELSLPILSHCLRRMNKILPLQHQDAFSNGGIHPEPGKPVPVLFKTGSVRNCSMENILEVTRQHCYKTFLVRNLRIFVIS
jgi:hypothetical protein